MWLGTSSSNKGHNKGPESGYISKVEPPGSGDRLDYGEKEETPRLYTRESKARNTSWK